MKLVEYTQNGRTRWAYIKDTDGPEMAPFGIPAGPPSLDGLNWPAIQSEIEDALASQRLLTWHDVERSAVGLTTATNVLKRHLIRLFRERAAHSDA